MRTKRRGLLVYPISIDHPGNHGILKKMDYQRAAFERLLGPCDLVCNSLAGPVLNGTVARAYPVRMRRLSPLNHYVVFYLYVARLVDLSAYDFVYIRYPFALPSFLWFLRRVGRVNPGAKIIVEIATYPYRHELQTRRQKVFGWLDDKGARQLGKYVDAIVTFYGQPEIHGVRCIQSSNGVDVDALPPRQEQPHDVFSMIAVGNLADRHGVDRAIRGLAADDEPALLHVVGDGPALPELRALVDELGVQSKVRFHGMLSGKALDDVFEASDVALDSLGIHRLELPSSSSLKAREYCARGIPFVMAGTDPDFPEGTDFVHRAPSDETAIDVSHLRDFAANQPARIAEDMRRYAHSVLTWDAKLAPVAEFLDAEEAQAP